MIFLRVAHVEDDDWDYFSFSDMLRAIAYLVNEGVTHWEMSDYGFEEFPLQDYTYIG